MFWELKQYEGWKRWLLATFWILGLMSLILIGVCFFRLEGEFAPGTEVDGVPIGGWSKEEALMELRQRSDPHLKQMEVVLSWQDRVETLGAAELGVRYNLEEILNDAWNRGRKGTLLERFYQLEEAGSGRAVYTTSLIWDQGGLKEALRSAIGSWEKAAKDAEAYFDPDADQPFTYAKEETGVSIDWSKLLSRVEQGLQGRITGTVRVEVPASVLQPDGTLRRLQEDTKKLSTMLTPLGGSSDNRVHNIKQSLAKFHGMMVRPGETVSFNETTGERSAENGYLEAPIIINKSLVDGPGGGVCQSSSTLYNAWLKAGLQVQERVHHAFPLSYVAEGFDATVNYPNLDLKFTNDSEATVYIKAYISGGNACVELYGRPESEVRLEQKILERKEPPAAKILKDTEGTYVKYADETYTVTQARQGMTVEAWRIYMENGRETHRELLHTDIYEPVQGVRYVGIQSR